MKVSVKSYFVFMFLLVVLVACSDNSSTSTLKELEPASEGDSKYSFSLSIDNELKVDEDVTFVAEIVDENGNAVSDGEVEIELFMENMGHSGRMVTEMDEDGVFKQLAAPPMEGEWTCTIYYLKGGEEFSSGTYKFQVT